MKVTTPDGATIDYPDLPITERREDLLDAISSNQVVVVAGETGSGKSTQLPKFCLELGRGRPDRNGRPRRIAHTQPRRIAARSVAQRVATELGEELGETVGFVVRFDDRIGDDTRIKVMTDGILLNEIQRDPRLRAYDTVIVDEAHERSLNIDFLLGHLRRLIDQRPDLLVIITSATIDTERFSAHFADAPIVEVSGRNYPVEIRYRPYGEPGEQGQAVDQPSAVCEAVTELYTEGEGDILVFFSGERDIRDAAEVLEALELSNTEIVPLFARLSLAEQQKVFAAHKQRRIVLATNVAETSLTVPGIRYVVDTGFARISRFNRRTKVQRLPIEAISQASADQRSGRCGRLGPGITIRLYDEEDYDGRPEFTEPEIQRTNLAAVIIRMLDAKLGDIADFPFVDPPDTRSIRDGLALLEELDAVEDGELTGLGRRIARLPVDPRIARMVLAGFDQNCAAEILVIAAALSVQDPRERPAEKEQLAGQSHARFRVAGSDLLGWLELWRHIREERSKGSSSRFRRLCRSEFLNYPRIREWQEVHGQLRRAMRQIGLDTPDLGDALDQAHPDNIHKALLTGVLSLIGQKDPETRDFRGARGSRFSVSPGSVLFKNTPSWVMASALVETTRVWAHSAARIDPRWLLEVGDHMVRRSYGDPYWDAERGSASALERATLFGLTIHDNQPVQLGSVDPDLAREMFIQHTLVGGEWHQRHHFVARNHERIREVLDLEARSRRGDLLAGDEDLVDWFSRRIPEHITSVAHFDAWWRRRRKKSPDLLDLDVDVLVDADDDLDQDEFPTVWHHGDLDLPIEYVFAPGHLDDGATVVIDEAVLALLDPADFEWHVPGRRHEIVTLLVRSLPKEWRRRFVPVPDTVDGLLGELQPEPGLRLVDALRDALSRRAGEPVPADLLLMDAIPQQLRIRFRVVDGRGDELAAGLELGSLKEELSGRFRRRLERRRHPIECSGSTGWNFGDLPRTVEVGESDRTATAHPTLFDEGDSVGVRLVATAGEQIEATWAGVRRLLRMRLRTPARSVRHLFTNELKLGLAVGPHGSTDVWFDDCVTCALDHMIARHGLPWSEAAYVDLASQVDDEATETIETVVMASAHILGANRTLLARLADLAPNDTFTSTVADAAAHLDRLVYDGFLTSVGLDRLRDIERYLDAIGVRLDRVRNDVARDQRSLVTCRRLERRWSEIVASVDTTPAMEDIGWMLQEFRVAQFAQTVGARGPISEKRINKALDDALLA
ncbi:MAG: ATP-dependent RNA helicase HrpA [Actinomycetia bacterium]|nr:ATP-dependent RNA helicase HrpA [Actinomycetes bacterium]